MDDYISRKQAIDALRAMQTYKLFAGDDMLLINQAEAQTELMMLPSAQPEDWMERNKERILRAGMEGREIEFRIGGRLFAIREKAQ